MNSFVKNFSKKLLNISFEHGRISEEKVSAILSTLKSNPPHHFKKVLQAYFLKIRTELRKENATLEHAGPLDQSIVNKIQTDLNEYYKRDIAITTKENPKLLAGVKIAIADDIWDSSVSGQLENLAKSF